MKIKNNASQEACFYFDEIWKDINGYEGLYQVSNYGRIKSLPRFDNNKHPVKQRLLKQNIVKGYYQVMLSKNGKPKYEKVHRIVAQEFIPNPDKLPQVNHIDGNKLNNRRSNLEWVTVRDNQLHSIYVLGNGNFRAVEQYDRDGNFIRDWEQIEIAGRTLNIDRTSICKCCKNKRPTAGGFIWKYKEELQ